VFFEESNIPLAGKILMGERSELQDTSCSPALSNAYRFYNWKHMYR